jgi:hypothetical protein
VKASIVSLLLACSGTPDKPHQPTPPTTPNTHVVPAKPKSVEERQDPPKLANPPITIGDGESKTVAGVAFTYQPQGHGHKSDGGWGAMARFEMKQGGRTEALGLSYSNTSPGALAEVVAFGQAFEISWAEGMTITHIGKARPDTPAGCSDAIEREAAAMGLVKGEETDDLRFGSASFGNTAVSSNAGYKDWNVHCAEQSLRVWVSRKNPRR